tara:strand:+ start:375 stop:1793 length:1419 start_codon:yes stop_codon:yes gene_type:complete
MIRYLLIVLSLFLLTCEKEILGCVDEEACNYNSDATADNNSCTYPEANYNCDGNCIVEEECGDDNNEDEDLSENESFIIVSLQDTDAVAIVGANNLEVEQQVSVDLNSTDCSEFSNETDCEMAGCMWHDMDGMSHCMAMGGSINAPHDIAVDNSNGYWFTTAMSGGYVNMYSTETNELLDSFDIGHMPALMALDEVHQIIYVSRGMPNGMPMPIYELSYESEALVEIEQWDVQFDYAHGIHFDEISGNVYVVSKTNDFIAKINPNAAQEPFTNPMIVSMDESISNNFSISVNRLRPIEITAKYPYMFITCSAGEWSSDEMYEEISGQVQMWHMEEMELLATYEFDTYARPWHIEVSSTENKLFVSLSGGDENSGSDAGVACIEYSVVGDQYSMSESWITTSSGYGTLHGITVHSDCCDGNYYVYSTGRTDGNIYKFDAQTGEQLGSLNLVSSGSVRTGGIDSFVPLCTSCDD